MKIFLSNIDEEKLKQQEGYWISHMLREKFSQRIKRHLYEGTEEENQDIKC